MKKTFLFLSALFVILNQSINCMDGGENDDAGWVVLTQPIGPTATTEETKEQTQEVVQHQDYIPPELPETTVVHRRRKSQSESSAEEQRAQREAGQQAGSPDPEDDWNEFMIELRNLPALLGQVMSAAFSSCVPGSSQQL